MGEEYFFLHSLLLFFLVVALLALFWILFRYAEGWKGYRWIFFRGAFYISKIYARTLFNIKSNVRIKVSFKMIGGGGGKNLGWEKCLISRWKHILDQRVPHGRWRCDNVRNDSTEIRRLFIEHVIVSRSEKDGQRRSSVISSSSPRIPRSFIKRFDREIAPSQRKLVDSFRLEDVKMAWNFVYHLEGRWWKGFMWVVERILESAIFPTCASVGNTIDPTPWL